MIGILNKVIPVRGLILLKHQKLGLNIWHYKGWDAVTSSPNSKSSTRGVSRHVKPPSAKARELQTKHGVPLDYDIIYNSFEYHTKFQYFSAFATGVCVLVGTKYAIFDAEETFPDLYQTLWTIWVGSLFFYINIGTAVIGYKSPTRIYYNKETGDYKAVFNDIIPTKFRTLDFRQGMVTRVPPRDKLTFFSSYKYKIKDQPLYMYNIYFRYPSDLYNMFEDIHEVAGQDVD